MIYAIEDHALLLEKARNAGPALDEQALMAEGLLGLTPPAKTGRVGELLALAVVLQINWQVEYQMDPFVMASQNAAIARRGESFKPDVPVVNPQAQQLVDDALDLTPGGAYGPGIRSLRGPQQ